MNESELYKEDIEKVALNAYKARIMAKKVGLFPEGNWKYGLRNLRGAKGKLLEGKELADAKRKLGAIDNNSYQGLKATERKFAHGNNDLTGKQEGTEIGGIINNKGHIVKKYLGDKGAESVNHRHSDMYENKRMFHTHPYSHKNNNTISKAKSLRKEIRERGSIDVDDYDNAGIKIDRNEGKSFYGDAKSRAASNLEKSRKYMNSTGENLARFSGKRNPLGVDMSGRKNIELFKITGGDKNKIKHFRRKTNELIDHHNEALNDIAKYHRGKGTEIDHEYVRRKMIEEGPSMRKAIRHEKIRNEAKDIKNANHGDISFEHRRSVERKGDVLHNILSPSVDMEGIHKVNTSGRTRSIYLDRAPKKSLHQDAQAMENKVKDFNVNQNTETGSALHQKVQDRIKTRTKTETNPIPTPIQNNPKFNKKLGIGLGVGATAVAGGTYAGVKHYQDKAASDDIDAIYKFAKDSTKKEVAEAGIGFGALAASKDRIIGQKTLYHGTNKDNIAKIKEEGLKASHGGTGGASEAIGNSNFVDRSQGKVHVTGSKGKSKFYAAVNGAGVNATEANKTHAKWVSDNFEKQKSYFGGDFDAAKDQGSRPFKGTNDELYEELHKKTKQNRINLHKDIMNQRYNPFAKKHGGTVKIKMDYNKYKNMEVDPDEIGAIMPNKAMGRHMAARGTEDILPNEIVGNKSRKTLSSLKTLAKNLPNYVKTNKGRFAAGVGLAGTGAYLFHDAVKKLSNRNKSASDVIDSMYKFASKENANYLKDIKCEQCDFEGTPEEDGRCPRCGAMGGVKPHDFSSDKIHDPDPLTQYQDSSLHLNDGGIDSDIDFNFY